MQDIYALLLWTIPGAIMMRVMAWRRRNPRARQTGELDLLVTYVIASVPVYGVVKAVAWLVDMLWMPGFLAQALASKGWFVALSWPVAVGLGWAGAPIWKRFR